MWKMVTSADTEIALLQLIDKRSSWYQTWYQELCDPTSILNNGCFISGIVVSLS